MPKRIQRRRTRGWRMPPGCVYVGRPSKWGNPFRVQRVSLGHGRESEWQIGIGGQYATQIEPNETRALIVAVQLYRLWLVRGDGREILKAARRDLRGKNLACWCPLDAPCHADVLLEVANA